MTKRTGLVLALLAACTAAIPASVLGQVARREVVVATATPTGNYFTTGNALCRVLERQGLYLASGDVTLIGCGASSTSGSIQNVDLLRTRAVEFGLVQSDVLHNAYNGLGRFDGRRTDQLRALLSLNQEAFHVLAGRSTNVKLWQDIKGKKVNLGPAGTTAHVMFRELLEVHGVDDKWLAQALTLPIGSHTQELCEGNIEVLGQTTGVPSSPLRAVAQGCGATLVTLDTPQIRKFVTDRPYYTPVLIPKDTYPGQSADVRTFGVLATLVATTDTPDIVAYSMVRAVFEGLTELKNMQPALRGLVQEQMIKDGLAAPLHSGALRYYRERGWLKEAPPVLSGTFGGAMDALVAAVAAPQSAPAQATAPTPAPAAEPQAAATALSAAAAVAPPKTAQRGKQRRTVTR